jgi:hypothetical protein
VLAKDGLSEAGRELGILLEIVEFQKSGQRRVLLTAAAAPVADQDLRDVGVHILEWLRAAAKYSKARHLLSIRPMPLGPYPWAHRLTELIRENADFAATFEIQDGALVLRQSLTAEATEQILAKAEASYDPPLMSKT